MLSRHTKADFPNLISLFPTVLGNEFNFFFFTLLCPGIFLLACLLHETISLKTGMLYYMTNTVPGINCAHCMSMNKRMDGYFSEE